MRFDSLPALLAVLVAASTAQDVEVPNKPSGVGSEQVVDHPDVGFPLPAITYVPNNEGNGRFFLQSNPINWCLRGINDIWKGTTDNWQATAGNYTDEVNGYKAGDGPNPQGAPNGQPSDYVEPGTEIVDAEVWTANIQYVIDTTLERTEEEALYAFLDDIRSKSYSVIDGFGPLTEEFADKSGAFASFETIYITDVTENDRYKQPDNDSFSTYGGLVDSELGDMVSLASLFRNSHASTSGPKYLFGTPRPWRMNDSGEIDFLGVETLQCVDGFSETRELKEYLIDSYTSSVKLIPGLYCGRRSHSSGHHSDLLYTNQTENRRKDNGVPSGHANAGYLAATAYAYALPERFAQLYMRGSDLAHNRIVTGMHSPLDSIGGRIQALMVSAYALNANPEVANAAYQRGRTYFGPLAEAAGMSFIEYVTRPAEEGSFYNDDGTLNVNVFNNNWFTNMTKMLETHAFRMTYGLPPTGTTGLPPIVPEGAEVLLKTRQPYLSDEQRRAVLATTEIPSGHKFIDKSNGWGRIDLIKASFGYGSFKGDVHVVMNHEDGGYSAQDEWKNDIDGPGMLSKDGGGTLILSGSNTYEGGTLLKSGSLVAGSPTAFGSGDLFIEKGSLVVYHTEALNIQGHLTCLAEGELVFSETGSIVVSGDFFAVDGCTIRMDTSELAKDSSHEFNAVSASNVTVSSEIPVDADGFNGRIVVEGNNVMIALDPMEDSPTVAPSAGVTVLSRMANVLLLIPFIFSFN